MYSADDLQIFVMTYNRAHFLRECIDSLLCQTAKGFEIIVMDNASTDNTREIVNSYDNTIVSYIRNAENIGGLHNAIKAISHANRRLTMLFHDDDILPPDYIEAAMKAFNKASSTCLVCSTFFPFFEKLEVDWARHNNSVSKELSKKELATLCYWGFPLAFSSVIYKTNILISVPIEYERFDKHADRILVFDCIEEGSAASILPCKIAYRVHKGQDSATISNKCNPSHTLALNQKYYNILGDSVFNSSGRAFLINNYRHLRGEAARYEKMIEGFDKREYINKALLLNAATKKSCAIGHLVFPLFLLYKMISKKLVRF